MSANFVANRGTSSQTPVGTPNVTFLTTAAIANGSKAIVQVECDSPFTLNAITIAGVAGIIDGSVTTVSGNITRVYLCSVDLPAGAPINSTVACTFSGNLARFNASVDEWTGLVAGGAANIKTGTGTSLVWDTGAPSQAAAVGDCVVAAVMHDAGATIPAANWSQGSGFTKNQTLVSGVSVIRNLMTEYQIPGVAGAKNGTGQITTPSAAWGIIVGLWTAALVLPPTTPPYTLLSLRSSLVDHGFTDMATARQDELLNQAYLDICSREDWPFLWESQEVGIAYDTELVALPDNLATVRAVVIEADGAPGRALEPLRPETAEKRFAALDTSHGTPLYYWVTSVNTPSGAISATTDWYLKVWPMADTAYTLTVLYVASPTPLYNVTDVPVIPADFQRLIVMGALVDAYQMEDEIQMSQRQEQLYEKRLVLMRDLLTQQVDRPQVVIDLYQDDDYPGRAW